MTHILEVNNLTKCFGALKAVDSVSFSVARGEVLGFLGPNGAGKSTTMKMITGFLAPTEGTAVVCGNDVVYEPISVKKHIGYLPEGAPLYGDMTARALLDFTAEIRGLNKSQRRRQIDEVVERVHLEEVIFRPIETLSKGFKRRVGLAQAILHDPDLLVLDEPTDGLDPNQKHEVRELLREMAGDKAIVISTHILEEVDAVCSRAMIIAYGRLLADGTPEDLRKRAPSVGAVSIRANRSVSEQLRVSLEAMSEVNQIDVIMQGDELEQLLVSPQGSNNIMPLVTQLIESERLEVDSISSVPGRLDDVFREITTRSG